MYGLTCTLKQRPTAQLWDLVSGLLYQFHSQGIEEGEEPPPEGEKALVEANEFEQALEPGILSPPERFTAYFDNLRDAERAQRAIEPTLMALSPVIDIHEVEERDYADLWKQNFHPIDVAGSFLVRAPWHAVNAKKGVIELIIEPGMAFGTGSHETTRACLELMADAAKAHPLGPKSTVLDFGCGSGILAIGLKKLGAGRVLAVDIDPLAIDATHKNAGLNGVTVDASLETGDPSGLDGIVANILKNTLLEYASSFKRWVKPRGFVILSGLLVEHEAAVRSAYGRLGFTERRRLESAGWVSLWLQAPQ
jgi:ribosomal protein L11 methyltransferase